MSAADKTLGLYVSVPFCRAKCSFCNFASGVGSADAIDAYVASLCEEIRAAGAFAESQGAVLPRRVDTLYFGGGTPSLLEPGQLAAIFSSIRSQFAVDEDAEVTLEAAPGQIGGALLSAALEQGVNRVSLGVQSFVDRESQAVGRSHTQASCLAEFTRLRRAGVKNVGADLIAGLPYQSEASWRHSLEVATEADLDHLSVYMLEVDDESRLGREVLGGGARLHAPAVASDELVASLYETACDRLSRAGFDQYEISNFAREGRRSRHNLKYWHRQPYFGFGLDAHSMLLTAHGTAVRWANPETLDSYAGCNSPRSTDRVELREAFEETVFLGLRMADGLSWQQLSAFCPDWVAELAATTRELAASGLMGCSSERLWLTGRGRLISGEVFGELLAGVAA